MVCLVSMIYTVNSFSALFLKHRHGLACLKTFEYSVVKVEHLKMSLILASQTSVSGYVNILAHESWCMKTNF